MFRVIGIYYLKYPKHGLFDLKMLKEVGPRLDEIVRTLRSDYDQLILKRMFEIANSKYG